MKKDFTFPSSDGRTKIHAVKYTSDTGESPKAVLQITHGMVEYIERYDDFAEYMVKQGFMVYGHDHAGHGESVNTKDDLGYFGKEPGKILISDMHTLRCIAAGEYPDLPYFMLGHSMGSYLLREYLAVYETGMKTDTDGEAGPRSLNGAVIMGTGFISPGRVRLAVFLTKLVSLVRGERYRSAFLQKLTYDSSYEGYDLTGRDPERSWLTKDVEIVKKFYNDPKCNFVFTANGYRGLMEAVKSACSKEDADRISEELPLLLVSGDKDPVGALGEGVKRSEALYREAGIKDVTCRLYKDDRHEIINETDRSTVYKEICEWMQERMN
ncbi:MAG: lysophospholipase [Lachnospiraceae bacterium]|nr:lysophospholipase [Lachnospiraceae bacterium]